jgi:hypothetical protein
MKAYFTDTDQSYCNIISREEINRSGHQAIRHRQTYSRPYPIHGRPPAAERRRVAERLQGPSRNDALRESPRFFYVLLFLCLC